jgi:small multidrug resistance family-3 protein
MTEIAHSLALFVLAALAEIGDAWLVWQGLRENRGWVWVGAGVLALGAYGFIATSSPTPTSGASSPRTAACSSLGRWRGGW